MPSIAKSGYIGCVAKLAVTKTNDTLCSKNDGIKIKEIKLPSPNVKMAVITKEKGYEEKISAGLAKLLLEKPLNKISVREIAEKADINSVTFYLHYRDVYDMAEKLQNEIFERFNEIVDNYEPKKNTEELFPMLVELFNLLSDNSELAKVLISENGDAAFIYKHYIVNL